MTQGRPTPGFERFAGRRTPVRRIIGGGIADKTWEFMVAFAGPPRTDQPAPRVVGTAVLVHSNWALGAAHSAIQEGERMAFLGTNDSRAFHPSAAVAVEKVCRRRDENGIVFDLAMVKLATSGRPTWVPRVATPELPATGLVLGWGSVRCPGVSADPIDPQPNPAVQLQQAEIRIHSRGGGGCGAHQIRAGSPCPAGPGIINGDSGGPLLVRRRDDGRRSDHDPQNFLLAGVIEGGQGVGCFEDVHRHNGWIDRVIRATEAELEGL